MQVLDDRGRLFGVVNVVDALVVLLVVTVAVAGAALVFGGADSGSGLPEDSAETNYATVEFTVPDGPATPLPAVNDTLVPTDGGDNYTVEDASYSFTPSGDVHAVAAVSYPGAPDVGGEVVGAGTEADMQTAASTHSVRFLSVNETAPDLETETRSIVVAVARNNSVGHAVDPGTTATVAGQDVATVESITANPAGPPKRAELIGMEVRVWSDGTTDWFGGRAVRVNNRLTVVTDDAVISGRVYRIGTAETESLATGE